ncbi:MAG: TIGR03960 family B12-binding radical SAM protein [Desulfarculus sp.]|nr:TIGR03960 family B12-binding radical SAM protein [Desulfarculus sp.]
MRPTERERLICAVEKPARYVGGEAGGVLKDPSNVRLSLALVFPEVYEIAMSHLGLKVLYESLAPRPELAVERVFAPWIDLMDLMDQRQVAPWSLESGRPLGEFDVIGFSLPYELTYTNLLHMLRLAGVPLRREQRGPGHPLVIAGGPAMVNPEPLADFLDLAVVGEAEELIHPLMDLFLRAKEEGWERARLYQEAGRIGGVYAPALFEPVYEGGRLVEIKALDPQVPRVRRRIVADLNAHQPPLNVVVPSVKPVHDRVGLEVSRGCTRGCRFCQAGYIYRPVRERAPQAVLEAALKALELTGLEELALLSLSTGDYSCVQDLATALMDALAARHVSLSLPSLRVDSLSDELIAQIKRVRKTGFTLAPEAGSMRLRQVINKDLSEEQIVDTARRVFGLGWNLIKLYFMIGLPTETDQDLAEIGRLCSAVAAQAGKGRGKGPVVHAGLGLMVPKPHTAFQWEAQIGLAEARRRLSLAKAGLGDRRVKAKWNTPEQSILEGVLSRGDRRLSQVLELAMAAGCRFDGWSDQFNYQAWMQALQGAGLCVEDYLRARDPGEALPWDHIDVGLSKDFLLAERARAQAQEPTKDCRAGRCHDCGVCDHKQIKPRLAPAGITPPAPPPPPPPDRMAYRFRLEKTGPARFLGHLETMHHLGRAFRRAGVELAHSQGFHPHAQIKSDSALPLGVESLVEVLEITTLGAQRPERLAERVNPVLPAGLKLADGRLAAPGEDLREPDEVTYHLLSPAPLEPGRLEAFRQAPQVLVTRDTPKGRKVLDLKATLKHVELVEGGLKVVVGRDGGRPKPAEILRAVFGLSQEEAQAARAIKIGARRLEEA